VAATIIDLANRGYLTVFNKGNGKFSFAKRRPWQGLLPYETLLLTQLFTPTNYRSTNQDIEISLGSSLFSRSIGKVYIAMYDSATQAGYFEHNPAVFLGLLAFAGTLFLEIEPSFILFFFAGLMTMALVIILAADSVPLHTSAGLAARNQWLEFKNYLGDPTSLGYAEGAQAYYQKYLPYAVVLKKEVAWAQRFQQYPFARPDWYDSTDDSLAIEDFANGLYGIIGTIGEMFAGAKEPTVE
jgi:hypothetical protein